ncbi:MAG: VanZ family protein [Bacteroidia bacterium]|nr:VanZ family protein [Bacteroidia bacterium]
MPHEKVGVVIAKIFEGTSRENYNLITLLNATTVFVLLLIILSKKLFAHKNKKVLIFYYSATVLFVVLCINVLFVMNVESIHFIQYAIFAILIYPLIKNFTQTIVFATIAGALDEVYQYFYLAPNRTDYFDWNDVIINLIGAAIGVLVLATLLSKLLKSNKTFFRSFTFYFLCLMALVVLALFGFNILSMYPVSNESTFALVKVVPEGFWSIPPGPYVKYHVVMPLEGILIIVVLCLFYSRLDNLIES